MHISGCYMHISMEISDTYVSFGCDWYGNVRNPVPVVNSTRDFIIRL